MWLVENMEPATINRQDRHGRTAVYCAAHSNLKSTILLLQEAGADLSLRPHKYSDFKEKSRLRREATIKEDLKEDQSSPTKEEQNESQIEHVPAKEAWTSESQEQAATQGSKPEGAAPLMLDSDTDRLLVPEVSTESFQPISPKRTASELPHLQEESPGPDSDVLSVLKENMQEDVRPASSPAPAAVAEPTGAPPAVAAGEASAAVESASEDKDVVTRKAWPRPESAAAGEAGAQAEFEAPAAPPAAPTDEAAASPAPVAAAAPEHAAASEATAKAESAPPAAPADAAAEAASGVVAAAAGVAVGDAIEQAESAAPPAAEGGATQEKDIAPSGPAESKAGPPGDAVAFHFQDLSLDKVDQTEFKKDFKNCLGALGATPEVLAQLDVQLRAGSIIAEVRGPVSAMQDLKELPLEGNVSVMGCSAKVQILASDSTETIAPDVAKVQEKDVAAIGPIATKEAAAAVAGAAVAG